MQSTQCKAHFALILLTTIKYKYLFAMKLEVSNHRKYTEIKYKIIYNKTAC